MSRLLFRIFGIALFISGLLWCLQGLGLIMWPAESFMLNKKEWAAFGLIAAAVGAMLVWLARNGRYEE